MLDISTSNEFVLAFLLTLNVIFYIAVITTPIIVYISYKKCDRRLNNIEKELHKLNDITLKNN